MALYFKDELVKIFEREIEGWRNSTYSREWYDLYLETVKLTNDYDKVKELRGDVRQYNKYKKLFGVKEAQKLGLNKFARSRRETAQEVTHFTPKEREAAYGAALLNLYKGVIRISMKIRNTIPNVTLDPYNTIDYTFWIDGKPYSTDTIDPGWVKVGTKGELRVDMNKAIADLKQALTDNNALQIQENIRDHFKAYEEYIMESHNTRKDSTTTYTNYFNRGHVAEAFQAHMVQHHSNIYPIMKKTSNVSDSEVLTVQQSVRKPSEWYQKPETTAAWVHVRQAKGTQRGTVAGDVLSTQVKFDKKGNSQMKFSSINNLLTGISRYNKLFERYQRANKSKGKIKGDYKYSSREMAELLVDYMTENGKYLLESEKDIFDAFYDSHMGRTMTFKTKDGNLTLNINEDTKEIWKQFVVNI